MKLNKLLSSAAAVTIAAAMAAAPCNFAAVVSAEESGTAFYVSPDGSDSNDGSLAHPFATLSAARDAVRNVNSNMS